MTDQFVAEIRTFPFSFAPSGWAFCDGQLMPLSQNTALFALLGTIYGGNGQSNFALPNLQGDAPIEAGQGPGLSLYDQGQVGGVESITLLQSEIPFHTHAVIGSALPGDSPIPQGTVPSTTVGDLPYRASGTVTPMALQALPPAGGGLPHNNLMPYLTLSFCIALQGDFPPRP